MGFFSALSNIRQNKNNFKQWEQKDADRQEQRKALYQKQQLPQEVIDKAKAKGKVIINTIDIMDNHSEEVAENTETVVMPLAGLANMLLPLIPGVPAFKIYQKEQAKHKELVNTFLNSESGEGLRNLVNEIQNKNIKGFKSRGYISAFTNKKNLQAVLNAKVEGFDSKKAYNDLLRYKKEFREINGIKNLKKAGLIGFAATAGTAIATFIASNIIAAKIQVKSSRIARWQSREELNDPKNFVQYTDDQIKTAKENLEKNQEPEKKSGFSFGLGGLGKGLLKKDKDSKGLIKTTKEIIKDNKNYENWKKDYNLEDKKIQRELSQEELIEAQKDKEVIQRITKQINNKAEEYSENMETAAGVLIGGTPLLGGAVGAIINLIINKTGLSDKITEKNFQKFLNKAPEADKESLKQLFNQVQEDSKTKAKGLVGKFTKMQNSFSLFFETMRINFEQNQAAKTSTFQEVFQGFKSMYQSSKVIKFTRGFGIVAIGSMITGYVGALLGLKLQKSSARAGRFIAKREIEQNPMNFVGYTEQDFDSVKDIKAPKKSTKEKFVNYITFLPRVIKEYFDYEKFKKTEGKDQKELLKELNKLEVSTEQLQEAKDLQRKLFTTFESVDDKSQEYSESMEAANEMIQPLIPVFGYSLLVLPVVIAGIKTVKKGVPGAIESVTGTVAKHTKFLKGKAVNKYFNQVSDNIADVVAKQKVDDKSISLLTKNLTPDQVNELKAIIQKTKGTDNELKELMKEMSNAGFANSAIESLLSMIKPFIKNEDAIKELEKTCSDPTKIADFVNNLGLPNIKISSLLDSVSKIQAQEGSFVENLKIKDLLSNLTNASKKAQGHDNELKAFLLELTKKGGFVDTLSDSQIMNIINILTNSATNDKSGIIGRITDKINKKTTKIGMKQALKTIANSKDLPNIKISQSINDIINSINSAKGADNEILAILKSFKDTKTFNQGVDKLLSTLPENLSPEEIVSTINSRLNNILPKSIEDLLITEIKAKGDIKKAINSVINNAKLPIDFKFSQAIPAGGIKLDSIANITKKDIENLKKTLLDKNKGLITNWTQEQIKNGTFRNKVLENIDSLPDGMIKVLLRSIVNSSATDEQLAKIFSNVAQCLKNIPTDQFKKILDTAFVEFKKNPQKFIEALKSGEFAQILVTKGLVTTTALASFGWSALSIALAFCIESTFASMQKRAGRLGVMKGLEELGDEKFYSNETSKQKELKEQKEPQKQPKTDSVFNAPGFENFLKQQKTT